MSQATDLQAWVNGGPRPSWVAANASVDYYRNSINSQGLAATLQDPKLTENQWWTNTPSTSAAPSQQAAQAQLTAYINGTGPRPAWLSDLAASQVAGVESLRTTLPTDSRTPGEKAQLVAQWTNAFLTSGVNSNVYVGGAAWQAGQPTQPGQAPTPGQAGGPPPATPAAGTAPAGFTPTPSAGGGSGVADPYQPVGEGFGSDYGMNVGSDPNFAFGNPTGNLTPTGTGPSNGNFTPPTATTPGLVPGGQPTPNIEGLIGDYKPLPSIPGGNVAGLEGQYGPGGVLANPPPGPAANGYQNFGQPFGATTTPAGPVTVPTVSGGTLANPSAGSNLGAAAAFAQFGTGTQGTTGTSAGTGGAAAGAPPAAAGSTSDQRNALADLQQVLNTYGLGDMAQWAWNEIVSGASENQVLLDLMQTPQFKQRFPAIEARQKLGLPPISPGEYVSYENQATQLMRQAGLPAGFWDQPSDFTALLSNDVSLSELNQRVGLAQQAAFQVPADVRATLTRDYGVGAGQLAAFFLDPKTAEPLLQRDFMAAQIGGAAWRTGYGSTKTQDERLTDLGVNATQAQQGFNSLVQQRQLFSSLPGENTTGITRDDQLAAQFGGNSLAQEQIQRRAQSRVAQFAGGGQFASNSSGFGGIGQQQI